MRPLRPAASRTGPPKILLVGRYADPRSSGGNHLLWNQASALRKLGQEAACLCWPRQHAWTGEYPRENGTRLHGAPYLAARREGVPFHIVELPAEWQEVVPADGTWREAVDWAVRVLRTIQPEIVHQHFWQGMWFFLEAAQRLRIPTVYSVYDWGLPCRRQFLVRGDGCLCEALPSVEECTVCCVADDALGTSFASEAEIKSLFARWRRVARRLRALIVTSPFARGLYRDLGVEGSIIKVLPWFHGQRAPRRLQAPEFPPLRLGFLGRLVPEKGLHILLRALEETKAPIPVHLEIAGVIDSEYASSLRRDYPSRAGGNSVTWLGWLENGSLGGFFRRIHALAVPSIWYDNGPTVLVEALAHGCPVLCTDVPSMTSLIRHGENGLVFPAGEVQALTELLTRLAHEQGLLSRLREPRTFVYDAEGYASRLCQVYEALRR